MKSDRFNFCCSKHRSEQKSKVSKTDGTTDANSAVSSVTGNEGYDAAYQNAYSAAYSYATPAHAQNQWAAYSAAQPVRVTFCGSYLV